MVFVLHGVLIGGPGISAILGMLIPAVGAARTACAAGLVAGKRVFSHLIWGWSRGVKIRAGAGRGGLGALPCGGWGLCRRAGWAR